MTSTSLRFDVYGENLQTMHANALNQLIKMLGVRPANPDYRLDVEPIAETGAGEPVVWIGHVTYESAP